jgi:peptidoglycan/xylan/chitin deacetylase (PgdA/CDA1 family)
VTSSADALRAIVKRSYFEALRAAGGNTRALRRHGARDHLLILNLHGISPHPNPYDPRLHPDRFAQLLTWLRSAATIGLLRDIPGPVDRDPRRPLVVLSFDDGLSDFVEYAMPVLASLDLRANQNVIGHAVETGDPPWAISLLDQLGATPTRVVQRLNVPGFAYKLARDAPSAKARFGAALTNHLKALTPAHRAPVWSALQESLQDVIVERPTRMMGSDDVAAAVGAGHEIGSHSYSHESMEYLSDTEFLEDFRRSRDVLHAVGREDCPVYAFPNGSHRPEQVGILQREGVRHVLLVGDRASQPGRLVHSRLTVRGDSIAEVRARSVDGLGFAGAWSMGNRRRARALRSASSRLAAVGSRRYRAPDE